MRASRKELTIDERDLDDLIDYTLDQLDKETMPTLDGKILGVNQRVYNGPGWIPTKIIVVLVSGAIGDYAAYIATGESEDWCKRHGDKLSFDEACIHFPGGQLEREKYRE